MRRTLFVFRSFLPLLIFVALPTSGVATEPAVCGWQWTTGTLASPDPIPATSHALAWTGTEIFAPGVEKSSLYDPAARRWRDAPGSPIPVDWKAPIGWTGSEVLLWSGRTSRGALFDPAALSWREIARDPTIPPSWYQDAVWTGSRLVVFESGRPKAWIYDPQIDSWRSLPVDPRYRPAPMRGLAVDASGRLWLRSDPDRPGASGLAAIDLGDFSWQFVDVPFQFSSILPFGRKLVLDDRLFDPTTGESEELRAGTCDYSSWKVVRGELVQTPYVAACGIPESYLVYVWKVLVLTSDGPEWGEIPEVDEETGEPNLDAPTDRYVGVLPVPDGRIFAVDIAEGHVHTLDLPSRTWKPADRRFVFDRTDESAILAGRDVVVFGGLQNYYGPALADGYRIDPATGRTTRIGTRSVDPPPPQEKPLLVWSGREVVLIGGDSFAWDPGSDAWRRIPSPEGVAPPDADSIGVAAGDEVLVVGSTRQFRLDPMSGNRHPLAAGAPAGGAAGGWAWDGRRLALGPMSPGSGGAIYDAESDRWTSLPAEGAPTPRTGAAMVWAGDRVVLFGGRSGDSELSDGAVFDLRTGRWESLPPITAGDENLVLSSPAFVEAGRTARLVGAAVWRGWGFFEVELDLDRLVWIRQKSIAETDPWTHAPRFVSGGGVLVPMSDGGVVRIEGASIDRLAPFEARPGEIVLDGPADRATGLVDAVLGWRSEGATDFEVKLGRSTTAWETRPLAGTSQYFASRQDLVPGATYWWQAAAWNECGGRRESEIRSFTTAPFSIRFTWSPFYGQPQSTLRPWELISFYAEGTGRPTDWHWDFGDGFTAEGSVAWHFYSDTGPFRIRLTADSPDGSATIEKTVEVAGEPVWDEEISALPRSTPGSRLRIVARNAGDRAAIFRLDGFGSAGEPIGERYEARVPPGTTQVIEDAAARLALPPDADGSLSIRDTFPSYVDVAAYAIPPDGCSLGSAIEPPYLGLHGSASALRESDRYSTELRLRGRLSERQKVLVRLRSGSRRVERSIEVAPGSLVRLRNLPAWFGGDPPTRFELSLDRAFDTEVVETDRETGEVRYRSGSAVSVSAPEGSLGPDLEGRRRGLLARFDAPSGGSARIVFGADGTTVPVSVTIDLPPGETTVDLGERFFPDGVTLTGRFDFEVPSDVAVDTERFVDGECGRLFFPDAMPSYRRFSGLRSDGRFRSEVHIGAGDGRPLTLRLLDADGAILAEKELVPPGGPDLLDLAAALGLPSFQNATLEIPGIRSTSPTPTVFLVDRTSGDILPLLAGD